MIRFGVFLFECRCLEYFWVFFLCFDVCFFFVELKRGIFFDSIFFFKLDRYKIVK